VDALQPPPTATAKADAAPPTILAVASLVHNAGADDYRLDLFQRAGASARATPLWDGMCMCIRQRASSHASNTRPLIMLPGLAAHRAQGESQAFILPPPLDADTC